MSAMLWYVPAHIWQPDVRVSSSCCQTPGHLHCSPAALTPPPYNHWHWRCEAVNTTYKHKHLTGHVSFGQKPSHSKKSPSVHIKFRDQWTVTYFGIHVFSHQRDPVIILLIDAAPAADQLPHVRHHGGWALGLHLVHRARVHS